MCRLVSAERLARFMALLDRNDTHCIVLRIKRLTKSRPWHRGRSLRELFLLSAAPFDRPVSLLMRRMTKETNRPTVANLLHTATQMILRRGPERKGNSWTFRRDEIHRKSCHSTLQPRKFAAPSGNNRVEIAILNWLD